MENKELAKKPGRLVFVLYPLQGHINPLLQLAKILYAKGFSITVVHPEFNSPDPSNHPEVTFISLPDNLSRSDAARPSPENFLHMHNVLNRDCEEPLERCIDQMLRAGDRISSVVYDWLMYFAQRVADHFKIPGITVRTSPAARILSYSAFPRVHEQGYFSVQDLISDESDAELSNLRLQEIFASKTGSSGEVMLEFRAAVTDSLIKSSAAIANTAEFLEQAALKTIQGIFSTPIFAIGPFHKLAPTISTSLLKEDANCISWLNKQNQNSVIYVSFGSMVSMDEKELSEIAWGLADSGQLFLWVIRSDITRGANLSEILPEGVKERVGERGIIVEWAPQKEVLAHSAVGGFMSHSGWNSTLESISEGVPMLCRPFFGDQGLNARYVCDVWKVGLEMEKDFERGKIEKDVRRLMVDIEGVEMRKRALDFKMKIDLCLKEGGSSHNSLNGLVEKILSF